LECRIEKEYGTIQFRALGSRFPISKIRGGPGAASSYEWGNLGGMKLGGNPFVVLKMIL
jgi:hypothetical protein